MQWYIDVLKKYAVFSGRARRKEYWFFVLFSAIASLILGIVDRIIGTDYGNGGSGVLSSIYSLAVLLPTIGVGDPAHARHQPQRLVDPDQPDPLHRLDLVHRAGSPGRHPR